MSQEQVPQGTIVEVLEWVGTDHERAERALEAERAGANRSTLITQLECITPEEDDAVSQSPTQDPQERPDPNREPDVDRDRELTPEEEEAADEQEELAPEQPVEVAIYAEDAGTVIHPVSVRDPDTEVPDDAVIQADPEHDRTPEAVQRRGRSRLHADDVDPITGDPVEWIGGASSNGGLALATNNGVQMFNAQQVGQLKQIVDKTVVGLGL